ncbi:hypothetical protein HMPREF2660_03510 [Weeksella sp. HMSC059D05]|nr:hypothetical protein HMPREF2660_03510 [Weeksella sp. HMSC059D05]
MVQFTTFVDFNGFYLTRNCRKHRKMFLLSIKLITKFPDENQPKKNIPIQTERQSIEIFL